MTQTVSNSLKKKKPTVLFLSWICLSTASQTRLSKSKYTASLHYPKWIFDKVKHDQCQKRKKTIDTKKRNKSAQESKGLAVIPYVEWLSRSETSLNTSHRYCVNFIGCRSDDELNSRLPAWYTKCCQAKYLLPGRRYSSRLRKFCSLRRVLFGEKMLCHSCSMSFW